MSDVVGRNFLGSSPPNFIHRQPVVEQSPTKLPDFCSCRERRAPAESPSALRSSRICKAIWLDRGASCGSMLDCVKLGLGARLRVEAERRQGKKGRRKLAIFLGGALLDFGFQASVARRANRRSSTRRTARLSSNAVESASHRIASHRTQIHAPHRGRRGCRDAIALAWPPAAMAHRYCSPRP